MKQYLPVWYLQAGRLDDEGNFECRAQGSAVLVNVLRKEEAGPKQMLCTVQHVLRSDADPTLGKYAGPFWQEYWAWPEGVEFVASNAWRLRVNAPLTPPESRAFEHHEDVAFLDFEDLLPGNFLSADPARDVVFDQTLTEINIIGYDAGKALITFGDDLVRPMGHKSWDYGGFNSKLKTAKINPGEGDPLPGASGGGLFHGGLLVGIYRGKLKTTNQHLFATINDIREWCRKKRPGFALAPGTAIEANINAVSQSKKEPHPGPDDKREEHSDPFYGRKKELSLMVKSLRELQDDGKPEFRFFAITGVGGIGKSRLVEEYIKVVSEEKKPPLLVKIDCGEELPNHPKLWTIQRLLAKSIARKLKAEGGAGFSKLKLEDFFPRAWRQFPTDDTAAVTMNDKKCLGEAWVADFRESLNRMERAVLLVLDNYESFATVLNKDGTRSDLCHLWIMRMLLELKDAPLICILSGRHLDEAKNIKANGSPLRILCLEGLERSQVFSKLKNSGVGGSTAWNVLPKVMGATGGHPLALEYLVQGWSHNPKEYAVEWERAPLLTEDQTSDDEQALINRILRYSWDSRFIPPSRQERARLERIVLAMLALMGPRMQPGRYVTPPSPVNVDELINEAVALYERSTGRAGRSPRDNSAAPAKVIRISYPSLFDEGGHHLRDEVKQPIYCQLIRDNIPDVVSTMLVGCLSETLNLHAGNKQYPSGITRALEVTRIALNALWVSNPFDEEVIMHFSRLFLNGKGGVREAAKYLLGHSFVEGRAISSSVKTHLATDPISYHKFFCEAGEITGSKSLMTVTRMFDLILRKNEKEQIDSYFDPRRVRNLAIRIDDLDAEYQRLCSIDAEMGQGILIRFLEKHADFCILAERYDEALRVCRWVLSFTNRRPFPAHLKIGAFRDFMLSCYHKTERFGELSALEKKDFPDLKGAEIQFENVQQWVLDWKETQSTRIGVLLRETRLDRSCLDTLDKVRSIFPKDELLLYRHVQALRRAGVPDKLRLLADEVQEKPASPRRSYALGEIYLYLGDPHRAESHFDEAIEFCEAEDELLIAKATNHLAEIASIIGKFGVAVERFSQRIDFANTRSNGRSADYNEPALEHSVSRHALNKLGYVELEQNHLKPSAEYFNRALSFDPLYWQAIMGMHLCEMAGAHVSESWSDRLKKVRNVIGMKVDAVHTDILLGTAVSLKGFEAEVRSLADFVKLFYLKLRIDLSCKYCLGNEDLAEAQRIVSVEVRHRLEAGAGIRTVEGCDKLRRGVA